MAATRERLASLLTAGLGEASVRVNGPRDAAHRLPNTLSIGLRGVQSAALLAELGERVAASAGAACHSEDVRRAQSNRVRRARSRRRPRA